MENSFPTHPRHPYPTPRPTAPAMKTLPVPLGPDHAPPPEASSATCWAASLPPLNSHSCSLLMLRKCTHQILNEHLLCTRSYTKHFTHIISTSTLSEVTIIFPISQLRKTPSREVKYDGAHSFTPFQTPGWRKECPQWHKSPMQLAGQRCCSTVSFHISLDFQSFFLAPWYCKLSSWISLPLCLASAFNQQKCIECLLHSRYCFRCPEGSFYWEKDMIDRYKIT